ncbi:MAG: SH3 domain-containing protein [Alphaproteobacteria bacterium]|nr:SH3 domain-containing protein [Alphaproteobacteria bacterium]
MSQRAAGFGKKPVASKAARSAAAAQLVMDHPEAPRAMPLELASLVAPFRKRGRIAVRVERLPRSARLSAGRNNGDGSWSLMSDELQDLEYLLPDDMHEPHTLAIRIVGLDGVAATTLAVHDLPIEAGSAYDPEAEVEAPAAPSSVGHLQQQIEAAFAPRERDEAGDFASLNAAILVRDGRTEGHQRAMGKPDPLVRKGSAAPSLLTATESEALAQALAARHQAEEALRDARDQCASLQARLSERDVDIARAGVTAEQAHLAWQRELGEKIAKAQADWRAEEASRFAAAEAQWQETAAKAIAAALAQADISRNQGHGDERRRLLDQIAALQTAAKDQDVALALARANVEEARDHARRDTESALLKAEKAWREEEASRLSALERQWQQRAAPELARLRERCERAEDALNKAREAAASVPSGNGDEELRLLQSRCSSLEATLAERESELARARQTGSDRERLKNRCASLEAVLAERDAELVQARAVTGSDRDRLQKEFDASLSQAKAKWGAEEAARLADADAKWRETTTKAVAAARSQAETARRHEYEAEIKRLRDQVVELQAVLMERAAVVAAPSVELGAKIVEGDGTDEPRIVLRTDRAWEAEDALQNKPKGRDGWRIMRDIAVVAVIVAVGIVFYPSVSPVLMDHLRSVTGQQEAADPSPPVPPKPAPPPAPVLPTAVALHDINVRSDPSANAAIVSSLKRDVKVTVLAQQGDWTRVRIDAVSGGAPVEGWAFTALLKITRAASATAPSP